MLSSNENKGFAVGLAYETSPWGLSLTWISGEREGVKAVAADDAFDTVHLAGQYKLGPGVALAGTIGWADFGSEGGAAGEFDNEGWFVVGGMTVSF